jgi:hypothetical protein
LTDNCGKVSFAPEKHHQLRPYDYLPPGSGDNFTFLESLDLVGLENVSYRDFRIAGNFHYQVYEDGNADLHVALLYRRRRIRGIRGCAGPA